MLDPKSIEGINVMIELYLGPWAVVMVDLGFEVALYDHFFFFFIASTYQFQDRTLSI